MQVKLHEVGGDRETVGWVEWKHRLKEGTQLTLKEFPDVKWSVISASAPRESHPGRQRWTVGGIG